MKKQEKRLDYEYEILKYLKSYQYRHSREKTMLLIQDILNLRPIHGLPKYIKGIGQNTLSMELARIFALKSCNYQGKKDDYLSILFDGSKPKKKKQEKKQKKIKVEKKSILEKVTFLKKPIVRALLLGAVILTGVSSSKKDSAKDLVRSSVSSSFSVKNLGVNHSNISSKDEYVVIKDDDPLPHAKRVITINKGIEKEHTESEYQEKKKRVKWINYYSRVYNLNEKKVKKIIKKKTKLLSYKSLNKENVNHKKLEFTILNTVKGINESIYAYQKQYGNIRKYNYKKKKTYREMVRHYAKLYGIDANKALAIEFLESGYYEQPIASVKHNPGSKRKRDGSYYSYPNMEQGIIEHMITLCHYKGQSIERMAARYCSKEGAAGWSGQVRPIYNDLQRNPNYHTLLDEKGVQKKKVR